MNAEQIKAKVSVLDVLDKYLGVTNIPMKGTKSKNIPCPIHNGEHRNFAIDTERNIATCFSQCNKTWNVIDLTMEILNVDFKEAIKRLEEDFLGVKRTKKEAPSPTKTKSAKRDFNNLYNTLTHDDYFLNRGLSKEIIEKYRLGVVTENTDLSALEKGERHLVKNFYRFIIPITDNFFIARLDESRGTGTRYLNFGSGSPQLLNKQYIGDPENTFVFITEGAFDALTIETLGYKAIALNSASNASLLIKEIQNNEENARQQQFILVPDNDEAGQNMALKLQKQFKSMNMSLYIAEISDQAKDINELASEYPDKAKLMLDEAIEKSKNGNSAFHILVDFFVNMKKVEPLQIKRFPKLNHIIGGLRPGLYVIGAISSLGKTTFVQEIADDIAGQGEHVLFFTLEMGKKELIAKSLVRVMGELKKHLKEPGEVTYTRDLLTGNIKDDRLLMKAVGAYEQTAKNLFYYEGMFDMNVKTIWYEVEKHINLHKKKPLVVVDYLQILQPLNERMTEKQATDKNVTELKRLTRELEVPLIAISSFNRDAYNREASFSSFKESGAIEYGSDVVIALELQKIKELQKDKNGKVDQSKLDEAKGERIRKLNLKILKNRFGKAFEEIEYSYITTMNKFQEETSSPKEEKQIKVI